MRVVLFTALLVRQIIEKRLPRWKLRLSELLYLRKVTVWEHSFPEKELHRIRVNILKNVWEVGAEANEIISSTFSQAVSQFRKRCAEEVEGIPKHDVRTPLNFQISFHILADELDWLLSRGSKGARHNVRVITPEIVKEDRNLLKLYMFDI